MKRHALFVGVDKYADKNIPSLSCAVNDATDLQGFFMYGAGYDKVELLRDPAGKKEILSRVSALTADLAPGDFFLFFFAGHGFRVGENHVLVCAGDSYVDVKYGDDGLPLGQLKRRLKGAFDSALFLDACQSDILATRGGEGIAERDIELILEPPKDVGEGDGAMTIVTSCDVGQTAGELAGKGHGLFTCAMLDILGEASRGKTRLEISDSFRIALGKRMNEIARHAGFPTEQRPRFNSTGLVNLVLLDGVPQSVPASAPAVPTAPAKPLSEAPAQPAPGAFVVPSVAKMVKCPICGRRHREDSEDIFECRVCHRDFLCIGHFDKERNACGDCAGKLAAEEKARAEAERRARNEESESLYDQAQRYENGQGVAKDLRKAFELYRKAAEQGYARAQCTLGWCYEYGKGVAEDKAKAVEWYRKAAEQGYADAQFNLGLCYDNGEGVEEDAEQAVEWYRMAAEQGYADAQSCLGRCYENGEGVEEDESRADEWYRRAAESYHKAAMRGDSHAQLCLGECYENGEGVDEDEERAVEWYRKAAEQGDSGAQLRLGECYENGTGVEADEEQAAEWYRKAAEQGDAWGQRKLGECYEWGRGVAVDFMKAAEWYRKAAGQGDEDAGRHLKDVECKATAEMYRKGAEQGDAVAQVNLGWCYEYGIGVGADEEQAVEWYRKAAEQGQANALFRLGVCYQNGKGVTKDLLKAAMLYKKADEQGLEEAKARINHVERLIRNVHEEVERKANAKGRSAVDTREIEISPGVKMSFVWVEPGAFLMGTDDKDHNYGEWCVHEVTLTKGYWIGKYSVTQKQWKGVMGGNPSDRKGDRLPVMQISWDDCQEYIEKVNAYLARRGEKLRVRLPTEAEWEFAACGGTKGRGFKYSGSDNIDEVAWYHDNWNHCGAEVGTKKANELGIHDMSGSVREWCADWLDDYPSSSATDPTGPAEPGRSGFRVYRGGGEMDLAECCRSTYRGGMGPSWDDCQSGVRLAASTPLS